MSKANLDRLHEPGLASRIGGAAQGGSAKPRGERAEIDRENRDKQQEGSPSGAGESTKQGTVGGLSNDNRTDQERESDARKE